MYADKKRLAPLAPIEKKHMPTRPTHLRLMRNHDEWHECAGQFDVMALVDTIRALSSSVVAMVGVILGF